MTKRLIVTAVEPEFLTLSIEQATDGGVLGGSLDIELARVELIHPDGRRESLDGAKVTVNLMRSDLETIRRSYSNAGLA